MRVLAAMSGGVDSAVAAALAVDAGHDVTGVHLALSQDRQTLRSGARGCCSVEDAHDARRVADELGIPFYVWDLAERFTEDVVEDFVAEYAAGRTPNPCLRCNEKIKFAAVLDRALALGFDAVVTGHHARLAEGELRRSVDLAKDQSYVLAVLTADQLAGAMFPLGSMTKDLVRRIAAERGFAVATKPDSHDICFIPDGDTRGFLSRRLGSRPGPVVDAATGRTLGEHDGTYGFTVGQRRGLGVDVGDARPRYVLGIEPVTRTVTVGTAELAGVREVRTGPPTWTGAPPAVPLRAEVQLRAHGSPVGCEVLADLDGGLRLVLTAEQRGVAPGQSAVLYLPDAERGDRVLGQGIVDGSGPVTDVAWGPASGVGSLPGTDPAEALRIVLGELPEFPHLPELPARGPGADLIGRSAALLVDLAVDLTPAGWRLVPRPGIDVRRAREFLARDLDALHDVADDHRGPFKVQAAGPWTLAAGLERLRGERAVVDAGARRDLGQSLAEGLAEHVAAVSARVPGAAIVVQLDEPSLPAVLEGALPTASGYGTLPAVEASVVEQELGALVAALPVPVVVHCCARRAPLELFRRAGAAALSFDLGLVQDLDAVGTAVEAGTHLMPGVVPGTDAALPAPKATASRVQAWWRELGFPGDRLAEAVTLTPACGLAGATPGYARTAMAHVREAAKFLQPE